MTKREDDWAGRPPPDPHWFGREEAFWGLVGVACWIGTFALLVWFS